MDNFPFNLFNKELINSTALIKRLEEKQAHADEIARQILPLLEGMTLEEVDRALAVVRQKCQEQCVVKLDK